MRASSCSRSLAKRAAMLADAAPAQALPGFARVEGQFDDAADDDGGGFDDL